MDLWIRSQDKEVLTKVIDIYKQVDTNEIWSNGGLGIKNCLGIYNTKERALEVLDEIQGKITKNECLKSMLPKVTDIRGHEEQLGQLLKDMIYEMPEE